jgi:hypothetical protein
MTAPEKSRLHWASAAKAVRSYGAPDWMKDAKGYIFNKMHRIKGYLDPIDALVIAAVLIAQNRANLVGGLAEIGVFYGRSFLLMAMLAGQHESAFAADLFDIGPLDGGGTAQLRSFLRSAERFNVNIDKDMIFVGNSNKLNPEYMLNKVGELRFFSIDGGHYLADVASDAMLAAQTIAEYGVITFDDFCNVEWPEVTLGVFEFLKAGATNFTPFAITRKKLYVCKKEYQEYYTGIIDDAQLLQKIKKPRIMFMNHSIPLLQTDLTETVRFHAFVKMGLGRLNTLFY